MRKECTALALAGVLLLAAVPCAWPACAQEAAPGTAVDIVFTHDTHSHLNTFTTVVDGLETELGGFARMNTLIEAQRAQNPDTLVIDGGDFSMGTLIQTVFETQAAELRMLGYLGCDVTTLGNHEFDYRSKGLANMLTSAQASGDAVPAMVVCNVDWDTMEAEGLTEGQQRLKDGFAAYGVSDYTVLEKGDVDIAVVGVFGKDALACAPTCELKFEDPIKAVKQTVADIKANEDVDMIVCVSHSGTWEDESKSEDELLAKAVPDLDLILSGTADVNVTDKLEVTYNVAVGDKVSDYLNQVMALDGTVFTPDLRIPVEVVVTQNGVKVADVTDYQTAGAATTLTNTISIPTDDLDLSADYTVDVYATVLENTACIASTTVSSYQTGIYNVDGEDVYYVDGQRQYITGVVQVGDAWYNLVNGVVQKQVTVAGNAYGWWYINEDGIVDFSYTGLAPNTYGWWYVENGAVSFAANGLVYDSKYGWWYVERSAINFGYTGLVQNAYGWWYVEGGAINFQATGLVQNAYGWWYVENGAINFNYNSLAPNAYGWWKITGGQVDFGFTGYVNYGGVNYRVVNGQVQF